MECNKKYVLNRVIYTLIQLTWGIFQNALGIILWTILTIINPKRKRRYYHGAILSYWKFNFSMGLGMFIFFGHSAKDEKYQSEVLVHEYGHTIQSCILGPFFFFIIAVPSVVWAFTPCFERIRKEGKYSYLDFYPEKWANYEGERVLHMSAPSARLADRKLTATVLVDNNGSDTLQGEWGLSIYVEYIGKKYLIDSGSTSLLIKNAEQLKVNLSDVDYAFLSHAHYDHSGGFGEFFKINNKAKLYLRKECGENCYDTKEDGIKYIGIQEGFIDSNKTRLEFVGGDYMVAPGVYLIPHKNNINEYNTKGMLIRDGENFKEDKFEHEQSIVFETDNGLVIFNSCCHAGIDNIINEIKETFKDKKIYALIGGFHMYKLSNEEIIKLVCKMQTLDIEKIVTGHCTGDEALSIIKEKYGDNAIKLHVGLKFEF